jgi:hypothetical protein
VAGLSQLFGFHLRVYERSLALNPLGRTEKVLVCWAATVMVIRYVVNCFFATYWLQPGREEYGESITLFNLLYILAFWIVLPFLLSGIGPSRHRTSLQRLQLLPLSRMKLFLLAAMNVLIRPVYGVLFALSLVGLVPLVAARPTPGMIAGGFLFAVFCLVLSLCVSLAGEAAFRSRLLRNLLRAVVPLTMAVAIVLNVQFKIESGGLFLEAGLGRILWRAPGFPDGLSRFLAWTPAAWVTDSFRRGPSAEAGPEMLKICLMAASILGCLGLAWLLVLWRNRTAGGGRRAVLASGSVSRRLPAGRERWKTFVRRLAPRGLILKEAAYVARSGDFWLTAIVTLYFFFDILTRADMTPRVMTPLLPVLFLLNAPAAFNCFGLDSSGFGRYLFLPVGARSLFARKNTAYFVAAAVQLAPVFAASLVRFSVAETARSILNCAAAALVFACTGNTLSIYLPVPRSWRGFTTSAQSGGLLGIAAIVGFWAALFSVENLVGGAASLVFPAVLVALAFLLYGRLLPVWERLLYGRAEKILDELKG